MVAIEVAVAVALVVVVVAIVVVVIVAVVTRFELSKRGSWSEIYINNKEITKSQLTFLFEACTTRRTPLEVATIFRPLPVRRILQMNTRRTIAIK